MPDVVPVLERRHKLAVDQLAEWLEHAVRADRLAEQRLRATYPNRAFVAGWRVPTDFSGVVRELDLLVGREFPFSLPRVGLGGPEEFLVWPHVEEDGLLCLPARTGVHYAIEQAKIALSDSYELVSLNLLAPPFQHFKDEFLSYWARDLRTKGLPMTSILRAGGPSRQIAVWRGTIWNILAEDEGHLRSWFQNRFGVKENPPQAEPAAFIWLGQPLLPDQYPKTASDIWALSRDTQDAREILRQLAATTPRRVVVVLGAESTNGPCLAAVTVSAPTTGFPGKKGNTLQKGFRRGRVPPDIASGRFWNAASQASRSEVTRADAPWVHGRGRDSKQERLGEAKVVIVGGGSVGAPVAVHLAMAGIGQLVIVDPEKLTAANTGRHPLGAKYIGKYKAEALSGELRENYPHHQFEFRNDTWQEVNAAEPQLISDASLIVSATADWNTDDAMNTWHVDRDKTPPIVYGWTEEHACAGHAVLINPGEGACFACGLNPDGTAKLRVTRWPGLMLNQEPGCGAVYQPYGPIELSHTASLISELAIGALLGETPETHHRIWACRLQFLQASGGQWTEEWLASANQRAEGGYVTDSEWARDPVCRVCGTHS